MKHVFGPVTSRRLGISLGIDPIPLKTCNYNCVYCQLGRTRRLSNRRHAFASVSEIFAELSTRLGQLDTQHLDWITIVGSGETTLFSRLGSLIRMVKTVTSVPVAVLTNGSLLFSREVRRELEAADAVLPSLDAGSESLYRRINRPHPECTFDRLLGGLMAFRQESAGRLYVETMLVRGVNDTEHALSDLAATLAAIEPDEVHLTTPTRPPAEPWVAVPDAETLKVATEALGACVEAPEPQDISVPLGSRDEVSEFLVTVIVRHPLRETELVTLVEHWLPGAAGDVLANLESDTRVKQVWRRDQVFWCSEKCWHPGSKKPVPASESTARFAGQLS
jgi:wyosine [tRNA(Phe)-imidazoG37] synthetase (radical SAM superfamily)